MRKHPMSHILIDSSDIPVHHLSLCNPDRSAASEIRVFNFKRGFNRFFLVLTFLWVVYCAAVFPLQRGGAAFNQYQKESSGCYQSGGSISDRVSCGDVAFANWRDSADQWTYKRYYRDLWLPLLLAIVFPPAIIYGLARGLVAVTIWVGRGFKTP
jgi:hypothetical protein